MVQLLAIRQARIRHSRANKEKGISGAWRMVILYAWETPE
jgi:hypothetical protein